MDVSGTGAATALSATILFGALVLKLLDFVKSCVQRDKNGVVTILTGWVAGVLAVLAFARTEFADELRVGDQALASLGVGSQIVFGLVATSVAGYLYDLKKAIDNSDTASTPKMLREDENKRKARLSQYFENSGAPRR
jgi:hypothetical protein